MITETTVGLIGEYLTAASLLQMGWRVSMAAQDKVDLVAWFGQEFIRVSVNHRNLISARVLAAISSS